jgi:hypothetical protein
LRKLKRRFKLLKASNKKRLWCFQNKKHTPKKKRGSGFDEKSGFDVLKIRNTTLKRKGAQPPMKKEASMFQK